MNLSQYLDLVLLAVLANVDVVSLASPLSTTLTTIKRRHLHFSVWCSEPHQRLALAEHHLLLLFKLIHRASLLVKEDVTLVPTVNIKDTLVMADVFALVIVYLR